MISLVEDLLLLVGGDLLKTIRKWLHCYWVVEEWKGVHHVQQDARTEENEISKWMSLYHEVTLHLMLTDVEKTSLLALANVHIVLLLKPK